MDATKTAIKSLVLDLRKSLEADIEVGLRRYGITPTALRPLDTLKHLDDRGITARIRMEETIHHEMERATDSKKALAEAVHWFVREVAFTHLNRLVGLKAMEVRGLIPEVIQTRAEYGERSRVLRDYREAHPEATSLPDDGLEEAIKEACRQVYPEFRLLFDVGDPSEMRDAPTNSLIWPSTPTLKSCIASINELDAKIGRSGPPAHGKATPEQSMWAEDEIIGWVYQFYNAEEKVAIRDRGKPKHPAEVAVINQFFTPRWIIKFLVDNTLGRLWLEMHPDSSRVRKKCDYLVPEPAPAGSEGLDTDSPINNPDAAPRRSAKRPQDIRLIDPACGTMHFGHYAFEVFQEMYADAREHGWVKGADALNDADVPAAVLENNLFGVDIDLRAVQLAALSLFMKAKSANPDAHVGQVNLIVADAHLPQGKVRTDFLAQYASEPVIQKAFQEVFDSLDNVAEVGSLLRVEERFRQVLESGGYQSKAPTKKKKKKNQDGQQAAFAEIAPGWSLEHTVEQMLGHLREFARRALREHDLNAQLFATETQKSVALLDVFLHGYDVVVMNPPYGHTIESAQEYLEDAYPITKNDLFMAFVERAEDLTKGNGCVGALVSKTFLTLERAEEFRRKILLERTNPTALLDLGIGILDDATVETAAFTLSMPRRQKNVVTFIDLLDTDEKKVEFESFLKDGERGYLRPQANLENLPGGALIYSLPPSVEELFGKNPPLDLASFERAYGKTRWDKEQYQYANIKSGMIAPNHAQFLRYFWEITHDSINKDWIYFAKGGEFQTYYGDIEYVLYWHDSGKDAKKYSADHYGSASRYIKNEPFFFKEGVTYSRISSIGLNSRYFPKGNIFSEVGPVILPNHHSVNPWYLMGFINSSLVAFLADSIHPGRTYEVLHIATLPFVLPEDTDISKVKDNAIQIYETKYLWDSGNEVSSHNEKPWLLQALAGKFSNATSGFTNVRTLIAITLSFEQSENVRLQNIQANIDKAIYEIYEIPSSAQKIIEAKLTDRPVEIIWPFAHKFNQEKKATEHVARLMSYCLLQAIKSDPDGILPLTEASGHATVLSHVQSKLEEYFGESAAYQVEIDSADYLGRPLGEWLLKNFWKDFHVKWYKNRPILWQLQSQKGNFACLIHIHKMDRDTLPKVRAQYFWPTRNACQAALESARLREESGDRSAAKEVAKLETMLEDLNDFEKRLTSVIEARVKCKIPDWAQGPYRNGAYDPGLDDGVAVNILPLQEAGLLVKAKVV